MKQVLGINLYTYQEAADLLGVHVTSIAKYVKEKRMTARTVGKIKYLTEQTIKDFLLGDDEKETSTSTESATTTAK